MSTTIAVKPKATVEALYHVPEHGKAELINGEVVRFMSTGFLPNRAASRIWRSLDDHERIYGGGVAVSDNAGFIVDLPHRESFSPDAAWFTGQTTGMKFLNGAPAFAVEVRSEGDYGKAAEEAIAAKRSDYFAAGTLVVWDVDLLSEETIRAYRANDPDTPVIYLRGEIAEAEPAVPGWRFAVDELFS